MITARQTRAARALLGWTQETLADKALVSLTALKRAWSRKIASRCTRARAIRSAERSRIMGLSSWFPIRAKE